MQLSRRSDMFSALHQYLHSAFIYQHTPQHESDNTQKQARDTSKLNCQSPRPDSYCKQINPLALRLDIYSLAHHLCEM